MAYDAGFYWGRKGVRAVILGIMKVKPVVVWLRGCNRVKLGVRGVKSGIRGLNEV